MISIDKNGVITVHEMAEEERAKEIERLRSRARHNEASALYHAAEVEREKWRGVVADLRGTAADKDAALVAQAAQIAELKARLKESR